MAIFIIIVIILIVIGIANSGSNSKSKETDFQRQERLRKEQIERNRNAELEKQRQARLLREKQEVEQRRRNEELRLQRQAEQERLAEQQRLRSQISTYKTNWQDFQNVLQRNGITKLYHFTDRANLASIRRYGGLYSWYYCQENNITIPKPGGSATSWILDERKGLQNYVRVSFVKDHPMLFIAQNDGRISNPVILEISIDQIFKKATKYATQNAAKNGVTADLTFEKFNSIKFPILRRRYFDLSDEDKPYYQAEVLILEKIPLECITNINSV